MPNTRVDFERSLRAGVHDVLRFLNRRAPHRFTGVYRYDGDVLRNVALVDKFEPEVESGADVPMRDAYCALLHGDERLDGYLAFDSAADDGRFEPRRGSEVVSYCGVLIRDAGGHPYGALCHFDMHRCQAPHHDRDLLGEAALRIYPMLAR